MNSKIEQLNLDDPYSGKAWLISFEAFSRSKQIEDKLSADGNSPMTDAFLSRCGAKALLKILSLAPDKQIETMLFKDIKNLLKITWLQGSV